MTNMNTNSITKNDILIEVFNAITHGIGTLLSIVGLILLIHKAITTPDESISELVSYIIYGSSLIVLFLSSTLYHSFSFSNFKIFIKNIIKLHYNKFTKRSMFDFFY